MNNNSVTENADNNTLVGVLSTVDQDLPNDIDVITSTNVFQHLKDINSFIEGIKHILSNKGMMAAVLIISGLVPKIDNSLYLFRIMFLVFF